MIRGLKHLFSEDRLSQDGSAWGRHGSREIFYSTLQYLKGTYNKAGELLFTRSGSNRTRENGFRLQESN